MTSAQNKSNLVSVRNMLRFSQSWMKLTVLQRLTSLAFEELCLDCEHGEIHIRPKASKSNVIIMIMNTSDSYRAFISVSEQLSRYRVHSSFELG